MVRLTFCRMWTSVHGLILTGDVDLLGVLEQAWGLPNQVRLRVFVALFIRGSRTIVGSRILTRRVFS
jgi:hypothetical protein